MVENPRILIIKTSSLGDIIHTLPALTDAKNVYPNIKFDWVVEESFQHIPRWHTSVDTIIPIAFRRWRKNWLKALSSGEVVTSLKNLRKQRYDAVIDAQGLLKSASLSLFARGKRSGFDFPSAREGSASFFYHHRYSASWTWHAVSRIRSLFANALNYSIPTTATDYGIDINRLPPFNHPHPYYVFLHGTTWENKHWPEPYWHSLAKLVEQTKASLLLLWGNANEKERAERIAASVSNAKVLPKLSLEEIVNVLAGARGVVSVDTGLGHLTAALAVPTVSVYGPTDAKLTGLFGQRQIHLPSDFPCSPCLQRECHYTGEKTINPPCFTSITPEKVFQELLHISLPNPELL